MPKEVTELQREKHKATIEYLKFFATLSTGSIVILTSFLDKIEAQPNVGFLVGVAFPGFMVCILATVITYTGVISTFGYAVEGSELIRLSIALSIVWISFAIAIIALTIFGLANL